MTKLEAIGYLAGERAKTGAHSLPDRFQGLEPRGVLGDMSPHILSTAVVYGNKNGGLRFLACPSYNRCMHLLIVIGAKYLIFAVGLAAVVFALLSERTVRNNIVKLAVLSFPLAFLIALIASVFYYDTRPFVVENTQPLISHAADNGFPSDHTLYAMTAAMIIFVHNRALGLSLVVLAILVGVSRVMARLHHQVDIFGSVAIAIVAVYAGWVILRRIRST